MVDMGDDREIADQRQVGHVLTQSCTLARSASERVIRCARMTALSLINHAAPRRWPSPPAPRSWPTTASISASVSVRSTGCRVTAMAMRFLAAGHALAGIDVEHARAGDQRLVGVARGARPVFSASTSASTMKAKSRSTGWKGDSFERRPRLGRLGLGQRRRVEEDLEGGDRPAEVGGGDDLGMQLAEMRHHAVAEPDRARAAGVIPVRRAAWADMLLDRRADGGQHGQRVGLGVEGVDGARRARPVARHRHVVADAGGHRALAGRAWRPCIAGRPRTAPDRRGRAPRCAGAASIRLGRIEGRIVSSVGGDRVQQAQVGAAAAEALRLLAAAGTTRSRPRSCRARRARGAPAARGAASGIAHRPGGRARAAAATSSGCCRSPRRASLPRPGRPRRRCRAATTAPRPSTGRCRRR